MNAGLLKNKIIVQRREVFSDEVGQQILRWHDYHSCRAYVNGLSGSEYWTAAQQKYENTIVFTVRCSPKIKEMNPIEYRIIWNGKIYDIINIDNIRYENNIVKLRAVVKE